jgi:hypothetical protein
MDAVTQEWLNRSSNVDLRKSACLRPQLDIWLVGTQLFFLFIPPMKMELTECSETSAYKIQTPEIYPKESIQGVIYKYIVSGFSRS